MLIRSIFAAVGVALTAVALAACGGDDDSGIEATAPATNGATSTERVLGDEASRAVEARAAQISVDGDPSDWEGIQGLSILLEPIGGSDAEIKDASIRVAFDDQYAYALFTVIDDYDWDPNDAKRSGAGAIMWNVDPAAGPHMGAAEPSGTPGLGLVDIWHWELECGLGEQHGGAIHEPGDGEPGNDSVCNLDDEWSTSAIEREDDNGPSAENSLLGVWTHTEPNDGADGTWFFELRRPLMTDDEQDIQFDPGRSAQVALAYWDPDNSPDGWQPAEHAQSASAGWIDVVFVE